MPRKDVELLKLAARGRWIDILVALGGIDRAILDGKHHPCPKCDGTDRFRWDVDGEFAICNKCFSKKNGDGFAALQWLTGIKFAEAKKAVAEYLGVKPATKDADPAKDLEWRSWSSQLAAYYLATKPGTTEEAILAAGGRLALYKRSYSVIAWPVLGESLDTATPVGWVIASVMGGTLPKWSPKGEVIGQVKIKVTYGSKPGLIGLHAVERLKTAGLVDRVWKVEGVTDLIAMQSIIPAGDRQVVVTNAMGAGERPRWMAGLLARQPTCIVHDADEPGQAGAETWSAEIAVQGGDARNVRLPYEIAPDHGKDLRDWIADGHDWADLTALADQTAAVQIARTETGEVDHSKDEYPIQKLILRKLQLEILYEDEGGRVRVFSTLLRKSTWIHSVDRLKIEAMIQICGSPAMIHIGSDGDGENVWTLATVKKAIALIASGRRGTDNERGIGIWQAQDENGNEQNSVVLVGNTEAAKWNGDGTLHRMLAPRSDGLVLDFGAGGREWYKFEPLERHLQSAADLEWREKTILQARELFERWNWRHPAIDPTLVTGLVLASWVQLVWEWRPLVSITGESNCGKSILFEAIGGSATRSGLFGRLIFKTAKSTEPGLRQGIGNTAKVAMLDEFEKSPHRDKIFEMLRLATRGETVAQGTSGGKGIQFALRHLVWIASTESGMQKQPDLNRFIQLDLLEAAEGKFGALRLPGGAVLHDLGQKLLAVAVWSVLRAKRLAVELKSHSAPGIDSRVVESYSVPAAMLTVALDYPAARTEKLLDDLLANVDKSDQGVKDHLELLDAITSSHIQTGPKHGRLMVSQIMESEGLYHEYSGQLESHGIRVLPDDRIFIACGQAARQLLHGTVWERQRIKQLLVRIKGAFQTSQRIGGTVLRGVVVPYKLFEDEDAKLQF